VVGLEDGVCLELSIERVPRPYVEGIHREIGAVFITFTAGVDLDPSAAFPTYL
jgi:hypothetical protein